MGRGGGVPIPGAWRSSGWEFVTSQASLGAAAVLGPAGGSAASRLGPAPLHSGRLLGGDLMNCYSYGV